MNNNSKTNITVAIDTELKQECDELFKNLGLNMSTAINMFLVKCAKTSSIPFAIEYIKPNNEKKKEEPKVEFVANKKELIDSSDLFEALSNED